MSLDTYANFQTAVLDRLNRSNDATLKIADAISIAEKRILRRLQYVPALETSATDTTVAGTAVYALPDDFGHLRMIYLDGNSANPLDFMTPHSAQLKYGNQGNSRPVAYSIEGSNYRLSYTPDSAYTVNILYYKKPTELSDANTSNEILANWPDALMYGTIVELAKQMRDPALREENEQYFQATIKEALDEEQAKGYSGSGRRVRVV